VILAMHHEQDMQKMGGLWRRLRWTRWVFFAGVYAIAGFPPFSGFFSKDEILVAVWVSHVPGHMWLYGIAMATAGMTAFYMFRLWYLTFCGECRAVNDVRNHIEDPNGFVLNPLWVLAFFSASAGIVGLPQVWGDIIGIEESNSLANFLKPALAAGEPHMIEHSTELWMAASAVGIALAGTGLAWLFYIRMPRVPEWLAAHLSGFHRTLLNKYYIDELYDAVIVRPLVAVSDRVLYRIVDTRLIDGIGANGTARGIRAIAADGLKYAQSGFTQSYVSLMIVGALAIVGYLLR
jgi:NADH-quinone oxidoreductase subunit L